MTWTRSPDTDDTAALSAAVSTARRDVEATRAMVARGDEGASAVSAAEYRHHCALLAVDRARESGRAARLADAVGALAEPRYHPDPEHDSTTDTRRTT